MQSEATETYSPGSLKSLTLAKDEIIRVKGTVSDLKDITKNRSHKKLEFKLKISSTKSSTLLKSFTKYPLLPTVSINPPLPEWII